MPRAVRRFDHDVPPIAQKRSAFSPSKVDHEGKPVWRSYDAVDPSSSAPSVLRVSSSRVERVAVTLGMQDDGAAVGGQRRLEPHEEGAGPAGDGLDVEAPLRVDAGDLRKRASSLDGRQVDAAEHSERAAAQFQVQQLTPIRPGVALPVGRVRGGEEVGATGSRADRLRVVEGGDAGDGRLVQRSLFVEALVLQASLTACFPTPSTPRSCRAPHRALGDLHHRGRGIGGSLAGAA